MGGGNSLSDQGDKIFSQNLNEFVSSISAGSEKETARAITLLEDNDPLSKKIMQKLYRNFNKPYIIGITGPAGSGKSSLLNLMLKELLKRSKEKIAVIAVDPSSQQSGGAFLGDRIRMKEIMNEKQVFIRSMASRGGMGGVNAAVYDTAVILAAAGYRKIIIETVGVGQTEIDIVSLADTTLVVAVPEAGDEIQIFKSELLEIGDIFILNKADLPQAARMEVLINSLFSLKEDNKSGIKTEKITKIGWHNKLLKTSALNNQGIKELVNEVENHYNYLKMNGILEKNKKQHLKKHIFNLLRSECLFKIMAEFNNEERIESYLAKIFNGEASPYQLIERFIDKNLTN